VFPVIFNGQYAQKYSSMQFFQQQVSAHCAYVINGHEVGSSGINGEVELKGNQPTRVHLEKWPLK